MKLSSLFFLVSVGFLVASIILSLFPATATMSEHLAMYSIVDGVVAVVLLIIKK